MVGLNGQPGRLVLNRVVWLSRQDVGRAAIPNRPLAVVFVLVPIVTKFTVPAIRRARSRVLRLSTANGPSGETGPNVPPRVVVVSVLALEPVTVHSLKMVEPIVPAVESSIPFATCTPVRKRNELLLGRLGCWLMTRILDG